MSPSFPILCSLSQLTQPIAVAVTVPVPAQQLWLPVCPSVHELWCWHGDIWKLPVTGIAVPEPACDTGNELMESQAQDRTASKPGRLWRGMAGTAGSQNTWRRGNFPFTDLFCFIIVC